MALRRWKDCFAISEQLHFSYIWPVGLGKLFANALLPSYIHNFNLVPPEPDINTLGQTWLGNFPENGALVLGRTAAAHLRTVLRQPPVTFTHGVRQRCQALYEIGRLLQETMKQRGTSLSKMRQGKVAATILRRAVHCCVSVKVQKPSKAMARQNHCFGGHGFRGSEVGAGSVHA
eukprot:91026-Amphidinium_carterae.1